MSDGVRETVAACERFGVLLRIHEGRLIRRRRPQRLPRELETRLRRQAPAIAEYLAVRPLEPGCCYREHGRVWLNRDGEPVCAVCHPPADPTTPLLLVGTSERDRAELLEHDALMAPNEPAPLAEAERERLSRLEAQLSRAREEEP